MANSVTVKFDCHSIQLVEKWDLNRFDSMEEITNRALSTARQWTTFTKCGQGQTCKVYINRKLVAKFEVDYYA
jgi:hypothetical protein